MINLTVVIPLLVVIAVNYIIISKLNNCSISLRGSLLFFVNSCLVIVLIEWFTNVTDFNTITGGAEIDKLISFNSLAARIKNTVIILSLFYLSYGFYMEYLNKKKVTLLIIFCVLILLSILYLIGALIAGAFII
jgi:hypothetical protein